MTAVTFKFAVGQEVEIKTHSGAYKRATVASRIPSEPQPFYRVRDGLGVACVAESALTGAGK